MQGRDYIFREVTAEGVYYVRTAALNANNGSPDKVTDDKNWSEFSAPVVVGDATLGITNKITLLGVGGTYQFVSPVEDAIFQLVSGGGSITEDGFYSAPDNPEPEIRIGLFNGNQEIDFNEFVVSVDIWTLPSFDPNMNGERNSNLGSPFIRGTSVGYPRFFFQRASASSRIFGTISNTSSPLQIPLNLLATPSQNASIYLWSIETIPPNNWATSSRFAKMRLQIQDISSGSTDCY